MKTKTLLCILITSAVCHLPSYIFSQGLWTQKANFGGIARYRAVSFSIGAKGYIGGGLDGTVSIAYKDFWEWDSQTNAWTQKADCGTICVDSVTSLPSGRFSAVGFSIGNKGYIGTGRTDCTNYNNDFWEYDPSINLWTQKAFFAGTGRHEAEGFSIGSKGYITTGYELAANTNDLWEYNPANDTWTQKASFVGFAVSEAAAFSIGTKGYVGTGDAGAQNFVKDFWEWNQATNTWTQKANFGGVGRYMAVGFSIGTKGYIGTGYDGGAGYLDDFWEWNQSTNTWTQIANYGGTAPICATAFTIGNKGYVGTGWGSAVTTDFWEFDPQDTSMNLLTGKVYGDTNSNCVMDLGEDSLTNWFIEAKSSASTLYGTSGSNGTFDIWVPSGTYTVSLIPKTYWQQVCPVSTYTAFIAGQDTIANLNFGADVSVYCPDLAVGIATTTQRRCLTNNYYHVQYWNNGTIAASNTTLTVTFDSKITPLSSTVPWNNVSGNSYSWNIGTVQPGQYVSFSIQDSVSCNANLGDTLYVSATITTAGDCDGANNVDEYNSVITGSFDPNAKEATTTSNKINIKQANILPSDTIDYTIHFQNTGTDTAFKVVIYDTLDADLDIPSIVSGVSSHPYSMQLMGTGVVKWTFNNILLPDSNVNEPASHGFVKFQIRQKPNNPNGTVIKNWAGIVFDFNAPVITDTVVLTVMTPVSVQDIKADDNAISVYPNPSNGIFTIKNETGKIENIEVVNILGEKVFTPALKGVNTVFVSLPSAAEQGIYFVKIKTSEGVITKKIVLQR